MSTESTALTIPGLADAKKLALITPESASAVVAAYTPHFAAFLDLEEKAKSIAVNAPQAAKRMRLDLRKVRTSADASRKKLGEEGRRYVEAVNEVYNLLEERLTPIEERMEGIEKQEALAEKARLDALKAKRVAELSPYVDVTFYDLGGMPEMQYHALLNQSKNAFDARQAEIAQAEADRVAAAQAKEEERIRLKAENDKLAKEAADRQAALDKLAAETARLKAEADAKLAAQAKAAADQAARLKKEADAKLAAQAKAAADEAAKIKKANDDRLAKEAADRAAQEKAAQAKRDAEEKAAEAERAKVKAAQDLKLKQEREAFEEAAHKAKMERDRLALEAEKAKAEAQRLAAADKARLDQEAQAKAKVEAAAKQAASASDADKVRELANRLAGFKCPTLTNKPLQTKIDDQLGKMGGWLRSEAGKL